MSEHEDKLQRFKRDAEYYEAHQQELLKRYPEEWVAILNEKVIAAFSDLDRLLNELEKEGIPINDAFIEHLTLKKELLILHNS